MADIVMRMLRRPGAAPARFVPPGGGPHSDQEETRR
jgi:hypothetical protein